MEFVLLPKQLKKYEEVYETFIFLTLQIKQSKPVNHERQEISEMRTDCSSLVLQGLSRS